MIEAGAVGRIRPRPLLTSCGMVWNNRTVRDKKTKISTPSEPEAVFLARTQEGIFISKDRGIGFLGPDQVRPFWMVWRSSSGQRPRVAHFNFASAKAEAERLARNNPRVVFVILRSEQTAFCPGPGFKIQARECVPDMGRRGATPSIPETRASSVLRNATAVRR